MSKIKCTNIVWDTDGESVPHLPTEFILHSKDFDEEEWEDMVEYGEGIADTLSDIYGWCIETLNTEVLVDTTEVEITLKMSIDKDFLDDLKKIIDHQIEALIDLDSYSLDIKSVYGATIKEIGQEE